MDIKSIKQIVNSDLPEDYQRDAILLLISKDREAIPHMLRILNDEREQQRELILDTNQELSRALIVLNDENLKSNNKIITNPKWVAEEIKKHYTKWRGVIKCNFKVDGLPE